MLKYKFALILVVIAVYLQQSEGSPLVAKKVVKAPIVAAKVGIGASIGAKIKLAALKKWVLTKTIAKAPFLLVKKGALLKIGAAKSLAAFKIAKAKKVFGFAAAKVVPAVAAAAALPAAAVAAAAAIPAAAIGALPAAAVAALPAVFKPAPVVPVHEPETVEIYSIPVSETQYHHVAQPNAQFGSSIISTYNDGSDNPGSYSNGYSVSLLPAGEVSSSYQYYTIPSESHGTIDRHDAHVRTEDTDTEVTVPHNNYGVPN